jgi:hypothetical protein
MTTTGLEPANADLEAPVDTGKVDSTPGDTEGADPASAAAETGKPDTRDKVQERFDKLTREKYEGLSRAERAEYRAQLAEQRLADLEARAKTEQVAPVDEYPTLESVGFDEAAHRKAVDAYYASRTGTTAEEAAKRVIAAEREAEQQRQSETAWQRKQAEFIKSKPDYSEKVLAGAQRGEWACSADMAQAIRRSDIGPEISYYLASNPEKSVAIAQMHPEDQKLEIGRIAGRLDAARTPPPPPVSKAPPPVGKIDAGEAAQKKAWNDPTASQAEFNRERERYLQRHR